MIIANRIREQGGMATERIAHGDEADVLTAEEEISVARARADGEAGRIYNNVTSEALAAFGRLDNVEAQRLLADTDELRRWFVAHA